MWLVLLLYICLNIIYMANKNTNHNSLRDFSVKVEVPLKEFFNALKKMYNGK